MGGEGCATGVREQPLLRLALRSEAAQAGRRRHGAQPSYAQLLLRFYSYWRGADGKGRFARHLVRHGYKERHSRPVKSALQEFQAERRHGHQLRGRRPRQGRSACFRQGVELRPAAG